MAMTHDYLDHLNDQVGISPANSQEELQAAQVISDLMAQHNVEPSIEEFDEPMLGVLAPTILSLAMFVGMVASGLGIVPLTLVGLVLAALPAALTVMRLFGREVSLSVGPRAQSQNVVAVHRAEGPLVTKGSRKIVVVAHYDSPRENVLLTSPLAPYLTLLRKATVPCSLVTAVCALFQLLGFLPDAFRVVLWLIGIVATAPAVIVAVGAISERVGPCTEGANDNKAAVAALLGVLENVRPSGAVPKERPAAPAAPAEGEAADEAVPAEGEPADADAEAMGEVPAEAGEEAGAEAFAQAAPAEEDLVPMGRRHGEEVLRSLGILPETCEIVYVEPPAPAPSATATLTIEVPAEAAAPAADEPAAQTREDLLATGRFSLVMDDESRGVGPKDSTGMMVLSDEFDADATQTAPIQRPDAPSDPEWGKTSFRPQLSSVARRASLFDLPDPSAGEVDPFDTDPGATRIQAPAEAGASAAMPQPIETIGQDAPEEESHPRKSFALGLLDRLRSLGRGGARADAEDDGDGSEQGGSWRGGATRRGDLRLVEDDEAEPAEDELRDAVLSLTDDELVAHDIWFVALGGSSLAHAGMRDFVARHRSEVRGCFLVNLDCIGSGMLTALKSEGLEGTRRADRRLSRLLLNVAADLHMDLGSAAHDWADTDATPAMRSSLRSVTLMGVGEHGLPALSQTADDLPENVSGDQAADVAALVTEMIRRS